MRNININAMAVDGINSRSSKKSPQKSAKPATAALDQSAEGGTDFRSCSVSEILSAMQERNTDPLINEMILALQEKMVQTVSDAIEEDRKGRSISPVSCLLRVGKWSSKISVDPNALGSYDDSKIRLIKVLLPSKSHWLKSLSNARLLRQSVLSNVFIRRSMSAEERLAESKLRQEARDRNNIAKKKEWVVYKSELKRISELPSSQKFSTQSASSMNTVNMVKHGASSTL
ncbi:hypothetical protein OSTOST_13230, partial [Ostertagia ostertagi]